MSRNPTKAKWLTMVALGTVAVSFGLAAAGWAVVQMIRLHSLASASRSDK